MQFHLPSIEGKFKASKHVSVLSALVVRGVLKFKAHFVYEFYIKFSLISLLCLGHGVEQIQNIKTIIPS